MFNFLVFAVPVFIVLYRCFIYVDKTKDKPIGTRPAHNTVYDYRHYDDDESDNNEPYAEVEAAVQSQYNMAVWNDIFGTPLDQPLY